MTREPGFSPHEIEWTRERSSRLWDYLSSNRSYESTYFSWRSGNSLLRFLRRRNLLRAGKTLDFGCGPGFFLEMLLRRGIGCQGVDFSESSVRRARDRVGQHPLSGPVVLAQGLPLPLESDTFDTAFLLETVEHLLPEDLEATVAEVRRLIRPGKHLVVTTPNEEDLDAAKILCPECGCIFHRTQHVRSWSAASLSKYMEDRGFARVMCTSATLTERSLRSYVVTAWNAVARSRKPNLIYVGKKA